MVHNANKMEKFSQCFLKSDHRLCKISVNIQLPPVLGNISFHKKSYCLKKYGCSKLLQKHLDIFALPVLKADLQFLYCTVTLRSWNAAVKTKFLKKTDPV